MPYNIAFSTNSLINRERVSKLLCRVSVTNLIFIYYTLRISTYSELRVRFFFSSEITSSIWTTINIRNCTEVCPPVSLNFLIFQFFFFLIILLHLLPLTSLFMSTIQQPSIPTHFNFMTSFPISYTSLYLGLPLDYFLHCSTSKP
jgi:hypothetical protein